MAELHLVHGGQEEQRILGKHLLEAQGSTTSLGHGLHQNHSRHHGVLGKVPLKEEVLLRKGSGGNTSLLVGTDNLVHKQKGLAVGQQGLNILGQTHAYSLIFLKTTTPL